MPEYPEIITELIKRAESDELRHFDLSSFMSGSSLNSSHLVGNFQIDWKESERILKDVKMIEDL